MIPYRYRARITRVIDGDTVDAVIDVGFRILTTHRLHLLGVDAPELNGQDSTMRERAVQARAWMQEQVLNKEIIVETHKSDSFGRWLGVLYVDGVNVNEKLKSELERDMQG